MNGEMNLFNPLDLALSRSTFHMEPTRTTTFNAGRLIPTFSMMTIPGDSIRMDVDTLVKMSTPVYPTMDMLFCDVFFFFVSFDLLLGRRYGSPTLNDSNQSWRAIIGAQDNLLNMPIPEGLPSLPVLDADAEPAPGSLCEYLGYDGQYGLVSNALPALAYFSIWNENFREPNIQNPVTWSFGATHNELIPYGKVPLYATITEVNDDGVRGSSSTYDYLRVNALADDDDPSSDANSYSNYWLPFPVSVFHGYYGSALPWPQRNTDGVELPLGDLAPVITGDEHIKLNDKFVPEKAQLVTRLSSSDPWVVSGSPGNADLPKYTSASGGYLSSTTSSTEAISGSGWVPSNLWTDLSKATAANVNALRTAIQQQRFYEKLARSGNRYDELKYGLFGVRAGNAGKDRPLYLGGKRIPLNIEMVASTNGDTTSGDSKAAGSLGQLGAFSHTNDTDHYFYHSFDDWGLIMSLVTVRCHQSYANGSDYHLGLSNRDDFYFPVFAHLGEQLLKSDIISFEKGNNFGYQQAWEEYRQIPDRVGGRLKTDLAFMTYADDFSSAPTLASYLDASRYVKNVDKTLKVTSIAAGFQFIIQQNFRITARRPLPTYSVPGLMDHF